MNIPPQLKTIPIFLYREDNGKFIPTGTGFNLTIVEDKFVFRYMVTCKHVVKPILDKNDHVYERLERSDQKKVEHRQIPNNWIFHNDPSVDIAINPTKPTGGSFSLGAYSVEALLTDKKLGELHLTLREGISIFFIGMFVYFTGYERNTPIVRSGHIAMISDEKIPTELGPANNYLLECQTFPGNSGAPVFTSILINGRLEYLILGIIGGFYPEEQHLRVKDHELTVISNHGISYAIPAQNIYDVLYYDELVKLRQDKTWAGRIE